VRAIPRRAVRALLLLGVAGWAAALLALGCGNMEDDGLSPAPDDCVLSEPTTGPFRVKVTINDRHPNVPVTILLGDLETGSLVLEDTVFSAITAYDFFTGEDYTATATYVIGPDTVLVVDSGKITTASTEFSNATCWSVHGADVDLQLRLTPSPSGEADPALRWRDRLAD